MRRPVRNRRYGRPVRDVRGCSRSGCTELAVATLTYVYAESTAVVGPLATQAEPHSYDLCAAHAKRLTVPRGWDVVRYEGEMPLPPPSPDELTELAEAVREAGRAVQTGHSTPAISTGRHLRVLRGLDD
ncbi:MAG: hypothetical protein QOD96_2309 [Pseudonocardiales bacterium]|nr:hypothetical protein [Pseudonocardiales bacterium]